MNYIFYYDLLYFCDA